jgi:hypothetical protein
MLSKNLMSLLLTGMLAGGAVSLTGCDDRWDNDFDNDAEDVGERLEDDAEDLGEDIGEGLEDAGDRLD